MTPTRWLTAIVLMGLIAAAASAQSRPGEPVFSGYGDLTPWGIEGIPRADQLPLAPGFPQIDGEGQFPVGFMWGHSPELARLGFNAVGEEIGWLTVEPAKGTYISEGWQGHRYRGVKELLDDVASDNMKAFLQFSWHYRPGWLPPEWQWTRVTGESCFGNGSPVGVPACIWNPEVRAHQAKVIETVCRAAAGHPALLGYVLANEPHWGRFNVGYGPYAVEAFHQWLAKRYGSITQLNARWGTQIEDFEQIEPPRPFVEGNFSQEALQRINRAAWLDWIIFRNESFAEYWQFLADEIRKWDPDALVSNKLMWMGIDSNLAARNQQDYRLWGKSLDVMGHDPYPWIFENHSVRWHSDATWSFGEGKRTWFLEWGSAGTAEGDKSFLPPDTYSAWAWQAIGRGVSGFFHFALSPRTLSPGGSIPNAWYAFKDGTFNRGFWVAQRLAWQIRKVQPWLMRAQPAPRQIAILQSWPSFIQQPGPEPGAYITAVQDSLYNTQLGYRYIDEYMLRHEDLGGIKVLLLPGSICLAEEDWEALDRFVKAGGWIIAWPKTGDRDELYEPHGERITERFGVRVLGYKQRRLTALDKTTLIWPGWNFEKKLRDRKEESVRWAKSPVVIEDGVHPLSAMAGTTLGGGLPHGSGEYRQDAPQETIAELEAVNARVIAHFEDGSPAITQNGHFVYIATNPRHYGPEWDKALRTLLEAAGVRPHGYVVNEEGRHVDHVDLAMMQGEGFRLAIVTNHDISRRYDGRPVAGLTVGLRGDENTRLVRLLDVPAELSPEVHGDYLTLEAAFMPGEGKVFLLVP